MHHESLFSSLWDVVAYEAFLLCFPWRTWKQETIYYWCGWRMLEESSRSSGCAPHASLKCKCQPYLIIWYYLILLLFDIIWYYYYLILFDIIWYYYYLILFDIIWSSKENNTQRLWGAQTPKHQAVSLGTFAAGSAFSQSRLKQCLLHPSAFRCIPGIGHWTSAAIFYMHEVDVYVPPIRTLTVLCIYVYITVTVYSSFYHDIRVCVCFLFLSSFGPRSKPFRIRGTLAILSFRMLKFWCVEWSHLFLLVNLGSYPLMIELLICDDRISYHIIVPWGLFYNTIMLCFPPNWTHAAKGHYNCCLGWLKICIQCTKDARWCCCNKKMVCSVIGTKAQMKRWRCKQPWSQNGRTHAPWVYLSLPAWQGFLLIGQCSEKGKGFVDHWLGCSS